MTTTTVEAPSLSYIQVPETSESLDWADLVTLDLSKFDQPGGKHDLATEFIQAIEDVGFFYVKNHGLSREDVDNQFAIASSTLALSNEEKSPYRAALEQGGYNGWKPAGTRNLIPGVKDNFEIYNIPKFIPEHADRAHPDVIRQQLPTIERFSRHIHDEIVTKLLKTSGDHLRYMKYYARSEEENLKLGGVWLKGHSDMGSLTLLFRQPVAALQVLSKDGTWRYVRPQMDALTVNLADALHFLTGGYLKSSIHRVVAPPKDQAHIDRLGVLYMVRIEDDSHLVPIKESPVLCHHGLIGDGVVDGDGNPIKAGEWVKQRVIKNLSTTAADDGDNEVNQVEIVKGVSVQYFD
ncbi:putative 1-aminocyclopropane-1-carboxylate oxidase [Aspergillus affinis]|uniref:putative 1-aminocyclopropane-1-carboxylate oxidase n=1 Tax=Aspergillus affinis TaxID=1070780 RepID=UPI0022FE90E8|nr:putative 1-aminocyclopropane-1-carboxylate oxidase [Aspergillus affinis]KAI9041827.1 putative 1-aminocyclopropane-1-carboxylate oxidase [Aspergillus affinis]